MIGQSQSAFACQFVIIVLVLAAFPSIPSAAAKSSPDISGAYYLEEKPSKAFEDVDWIALFAVDAKGRKVPLHGFIRLKDRYRGRFVNFFLVNPSLKDHTLTFSTRVVRGIHYRFNGQFLKLENLEDGEIVLQGQLSKFQNGEKVGEVNARYTYSAGD
jgi:hypothetical protein